MNNFFGIYGGQFVGEALMPLLHELEQAYLEAKADPYFIAQMQRLQKEYIGRETPLYYASRLSDYCSGAQIFLKREDLNHTGAHKVNNTLGQALLAKRMGKTRLIAETGAGMHGVATATMAALFGMECEIFMGSEDVARQAPNVERMQILGAKVRSVSEGSAGLKDAMNEAIRNWVETIDNTFYVIGTAAGPHPYPSMVRDFQSIIGTEARRQIIEMTGQLPDAAVAVVGGGSNAIGLFSAFLDDLSVQLVGVEAAGEGLETGRHAATIEKGRVGVLHGFKCYLLQNADGQVIPTHSISAGLDYPGVGPEHCYLNDIGRVKYLPINDDEAVDAFLKLSQLEGIIPAMESSHAVAQAMKMAAKMPKDKSILVNLSGRGDKDMQNVMKYLKANNIPLGEIRETNGIQAFQSAHSGKGLEK